MFTPFSSTYLTIGSLQFRYYGLMYFLAFIMAYFFLNYFRKKKYIKLSSNDLWDLIFYGVLGIVIGGRLGYIIFYNLNYFIENPTKIIAVWEGGLSFHGGLIGILIGEYIFCKVKNLNFLNLADYAVIPLSLGIALGKLGNFINGELIGRSLETTFYVPWGMYFELANNDTLRHPSVLYEMGKNIIIFMVLIILIKKYPRLKTGTLLAIFLLLYGIMRFLIEFVREPDPQIGLFLNMFSMGQILCSVMIIGGGLLLMRNLRYPE
jgi:phosphatidylglycerol:prolipoprotein diacylglycerol transferase